MEQQQGITKFASRGPWGKEGGQVPHMAYSLAFLHTQPVWQKVYALEVALDLS